MDKIIDLIAIVHQEVIWYHQAPSQYGQTLYFEDVKQQRFIVVFIPDYNPSRPQKPGVVVSAQIHQDTIIIDADTTDRPLYEALMGAGIPREKIILAYAGEKLP
ncbi:MAG TPA: element excision factor XisI family protein, partial [Aggregatilineales bacterium]|nr:element excision factor XisI family protein [Aggregatilineales bacterium]